MKLLTIALTLIILIGLMPQLSATDDWAATGWCSQSDLSYGKPEVELSLHEPSDLDKAYGEQMSEVKGCVHKPKSPEQICLGLLIKMDKLGTIVTPKSDIAKYKLLNTKWYRMDYSLPLTEKGFYPVVKHRIIKKAEEICDNKRILDKAERLYKKL